MTESTKHGIVDRWNQFWFQPVSAESLGLIRLFFGFTFFWKLTGSFALLRIGSQPIRWQFPQPFVFDVQRLGESGEGWWMPWPGFNWLPTLSQAQISWLVFALAILSVLITLGLFTRWVTLAAASITTYLFLLSQWNYHHHTILFIFMLWLLALTPSGRFFSLDARRLEAKPGDDRTWILPLRLIQVLVSFIYLSSFISKCDPVWWNGSIIKLYHELGAMRGPYFEYGIGITGYQLAGILAVLAEGFLAFGLLLPQTRRVAFLVGILLHVGIDASMQVSTYGYQMIALYIAFIVPRSGGMVVLYDGRCGMCKGSRRMSRLLDWLARISWLDFRQPETQQQVPFLTNEQMEKEMYVITADGRVFAGFKAWRELLARFPLTFLASFFFYLPPLSLVGGSIYQFIADRRKLACEVSLPTNEPTSAELTFAKARERQT